MGVLGILPKEDTLFASIVKDGQKTSHDPDSGLVGGIRARVEAVALPVMAILDTVMQALQGIGETVKFSVQFIRRQDERSLGMAVRHYELSLRSIAAIAVGCLAAITGLVAPGQTFARLAATPVIVSVDS